MSDEPIDVERMTEEQWKAHLTAEQYRIARQKETERAFTGAYWDTKEPGTYRCVCCGNELFDSDAKYDSGTGWPSFTAAAGDVRTEEDLSLGMRRTEVLCAACDAHLGHVFLDGPGSGEQRYCINSASLQLDSREPDTE